MHVSLTMTVACYVAELEAAKNADTWIMIGEPENKGKIIAVRSNSTGLKNCQYEIMRLMHVLVKKGNGEKAIGRQNIVELTVKN